jgi:hypothetical protein
MILEGKMALYKRGFHVLMRRLKELVKDRKNLKRELRRAENLLQIHADLVFACVGGEI